MAPNMRKRDKKREKAKAELRDKKRKEVWVDVEVGEGGKRGNGHRQRVSGSGYDLGGD
jgi:signal recognition particle subunit SRP14